MTAMARTAAGGSREFYSTLLTPGVGQRENKAGIVSSCSRKQGKTRLEDRGPPVDLSGNMECTNTNEFPLAINKTNRQKNPFLAPLPVIFSFLIPSKLKEHKCVFQKELLSQSFVCMPANK